VYFTKHTTNFGNPGDEFYLSHLV